ncbi:hypothetical protein FRC07_013665, partial [Ceratobasidium sp. 392]
MSPINESALATLRTNLSPKASVALPGEPEYSIKRWALNAEKPAAAVAYPATPEDVAQILAFVQGKAPYEAQQRIDFAVKGGGHTPSGASSTDGGLVIDLQPQLNSVRVDPEAKLAYVSGGALWGDVDEATVKHGLASVSGVVSHTGVVSLSAAVSVGSAANTASSSTTSSNTHSSQLPETSSPSQTRPTQTCSGLSAEAERPDLYTSTLIFPPTAIEKVIPEVNDWLKERTPEENMHIVFANGPSGH